MLIRIPRRQYGNCLYAWRGDEGMTDALTAEVKQRRNHLLVHAPYVAWWNVLAALQADTFGPLGGSKQSKRYASMHAITTVATAINAMDNHPGLREAGVVGQLDAMLLPAWRLPEPDGRGRSYTPMPTPGLPFDVLRPHWIRIGSTDVTIWVPSANSVVAHQDRRLEEGFHLSLMR